MATTVKRAQSLDVQSTFAQHLSYKKEAARIAGRSEALKNRLKDFLLARPAASYANENGSVFYDLDETIEVGGNTFRGMELRRSASQIFVEDVAEKILKKKGIYEEALSTYVDQNKVYRLVQEGKITEKEVDKMFEESESFAFWPVKGEVV